MKFQVLSDIHLDFYKQYPGIDYFIKNKSADYLCLCGDIGNPFRHSYKTFLHECSQYYKYVFIIAGNTEFYDHEIHEIDLEIGRICQNISKNLIFLNNAGFDIPRSNVRVIGSTLWSHITEKQLYMVKLTVSDFLRIKKMDVNMYESKHKESVDYINSELTNENNLKKRFVVITHHAPLLNIGNPKYLGSTISSAFETDLSHLFHSNVSMWFYGHNHYNKVFMKHHTIVASNQVGYPDEHVFYQDCIFSLP
jgi:Icc-related predicted phosphoesterase